MVTKTEEVDWSARDGAWNLCAGQVTPWGTHLGGESHCSPFMQLLQLSCQTVRYSSGASGSCLSQHWFGLATALVTKSLSLVGEENEPDARTFELATSLNGNETTSLKKASLDYDAIVEFMRYYGYYGQNLTLDAIKQNFKCAPCDACQDATWQRDAHRLQLGWGGAGDSSLEPRCPPPQENN